MDYVLDACAMIAFLNDEPGAETVTELLSQAKAGTNHLFMSSIQVLEVYYDRIYVMGCDYADNFLKSLFAFPIVILPEININIIQEAGRFKTSYSMSLADSIAAATAKILGAVLVTKDDEIRAAEKAGEFSVLWLK